MASYTFTLPGSTKTFTVKGPDGFTEAQARAIFNEQANAGSLIGFKTGDILSAATQAADGLPGALSQLSQTLTGKPGVGTTILSSAAAIAQTAAAKVTSIKTLSFTTITDTITKTQLANVITPGDYATQAPAIAPIQNISIPEVTAGMSQAAKLTGQKTTELSNNGAGKFALNLSQLESSGVLKPGTAATFANSTTPVAEILKSPAIYTGKDGINNVDSLLSSAVKQDLIQQNLMSKGLSALGKLGVPTDLLSSGAALGTALNAAKSIPFTTAWANGKPLSPEIKQQFDELAKGGAYASDLVNKKLNEPMKQEIIPIAASDTVNRETVNAAASRVVGNEKVPTVSYDNSYKIDIVKFGNRVNTAVTDGIALRKETRKVINEATDEDIPLGIRNLERVLGDWKTLDATYLGLQREAKLVETQYGFAPPQLSIIEKELAFNATFIKTLENDVAELKKRVEASAG